MRKREDDHLVGVWKHPTGGWEIKYQKGGKKFSEYRKDRREADLRAAYWRSTLANPPQAEEGEYEHPVIYWERLLRRAAEMALNNPGNKEIAETCRSLASAANAALKSARYLDAPPTMTSNSDDIKSPDDIKNMTTEELKELLK